ncbi:decaprenyl-phosphate phosphoribosyltransferase [Nocardioides dongkuii]|uniref:decaprenyl-phosphate phosphoribosyltransferase n=1 Tax=Nocardioides dongkuii TaxID=2760089 RepID=UPI001878C4F9|nr:decaprenyl-phosphate phosphoribosyltransferase [Nocardioides dongkuii]
MASTSERWPVPVDERALATASRGRRWYALLLGTRPRQALTKNLLVLTAPALGGQLLSDAAVVPGTLVAFVAFVTLSSAVYLVNDVRDVELDRCHPTKSRRPIASGALRVPFALGGALVLAAGGLGLALWWSPALAVVLLTYVLVQAAYCTHLKHVPGVDMVTVVSGFVLRVVAGGVAAAVEVSVPFVVVVGLAALFMVAGKRYSEMWMLGAAAGTRSSLARYSLRSLRLVWALSGAFAVVGYAVAATGLAPLGSAAAAWAIVSVPLFAAGMARYAQHVRLGRAGSPERVVYGDWILQVLGALWLAPLVAAVVLA